MLTDHVELLRGAFRETHQRDPFTIDAIVKHGLVSRVRDWAPSSFHRHVRLGNYPTDWAGDRSDDGRDYGERG